ncbi:MAG: cupin domain-containing protein [Verrucomicrobiia bacterium]
MKTIVSIALLAAAINTGWGQCMDKISPDIAGKAVALTNAPNAPASPVAATYIDGAKVTAAFDKGQTLAEAHGYKVMASRRDKPGPVEIHTYETDVFYIIQGTATFVTGGTCADAKITAPGQLRGTSIIDGVTHHLKKGDVIIVPAGLPHQFTEASNPFLYFTVKPIKAE